MMDDKGGAAKGGTLRLGLSVGKLSLPEGGGISITDSVKQAAMASRRSMAVVKGKDVKPKSEQPSKQLGNLVRSPWLTEAEQESRSAALSRALTSTTKSRSRALMSPEELTAHVAEEAKIKTEDVIPETVAVESTEKRKRNKKAVSKIEEVEDKTMLKSKEFKVKKRQMRTDWRKSTEDLVWSEAPTIEDPIEIIERKQSNNRRKNQRPPMPVPSKKDSNIIIINGELTAQALASKLSLKTDKIIKVMRECGLDHNEEMSAEEAAIISGELGFNFRIELYSDVLKLFDFKADEIEGGSRPPVVTFMGHVDHGKTSLLDAFRNSQVAAGEAGGITQHMGAYQVTTSSGRSVTFIDTPGHEAFTKMRSRGARATDIVVLVVAADDGVMPQTVEAINHAKAANVPIILAINKMDKPGADPNRVRNSLLQYNIMTEHVGGDVVSVEVSATKKINLDKLEEAILVVSDMMELKANQECYAKGVVLETKLDKQRGIIATLLVQVGTLHKGDILVAGSSYCRVRHMSDCRGNAVTQVTPSTPVEVLGFDSMPESGDRFIVLRSEQAARDVIEKISKIAEKSVAVKVADASTLFDNTKIIEANFIVKADTNGSAQAISDQLTNIRNEELTVNVVHSGVGKVTESDITLAEISKSGILAFNLPNDHAIMRMAQGKGVSIMNYDIIYHLLDDVRARVSQMLSPVIHEKIVASAVVKQVFDLGRVGKVAGCGVTQGPLRRDSNVRLRRKGIVIYNGKINTLKHYKENVAEVKSGMECGIAFDRWGDVLPGDTIDAYEITEEKQKL